MIYGSNSGTFGSPCHSWVANAPPWLCVFNCTKSSYLFHSVAYHDVGAARIVEETGGGVEWDIPSDG